MKKKVVFSTELAYIIGIILIALGTALTVKADFGVSMVVAPAYLIYLKMSQIFSFVTFGMAEYCFQAVLLILMCIVLRRFRLSWLFSFVTAVIYGFILDGWTLLVDLIPSSSVPARVLCYIFGILVCASGVSLTFHTYISPEVYELFVKKVSDGFGLNINKFKTAYDCTSFAVAVIMSFCFFGLGHFEGVNFGTVICALVNGFLISCFSKIYDRFFVFEDKLPLKRFFKD